MIIGIRNFKLPNNCYECQFVDKDKLTCTCEFSDYNYNVADCHEERHVECPFIPIPGKHEDFCGRQLVFIK